MVHAEKPDVVICAGDFTIFEQHIEQIVEKLSHLKPMLLINGNHESEEATKVLCKRHGITFLHGSTVDMGGVTFVGWGGGGFEEEDEEFEKFAKTVKTKNPVVLVTHAPVYGTETDRIWGDHRGCKSFADFVRTHNVRVAVCGHFHENAGKHSKLKNAVVINPGPSGAVIEFEQ